MQNYEVGEKVQMADSFELDLIEESDTHNRITLTVRSSAIVEFVGYSYGMVEVNIPLKDKIFLKVRLHDSYIEPLPKTLTEELYKQELYVDECAKIILEKIPSTWVDYNQLWGLCGAVNSPDYMKTVSILAKKGRIDSSLKQDVWHYRRKQ